MKKLCLVCVIGLLGVSAHAQKQALFLTAATLAAGDNAVSNRLASLGFVVTRVIDTASVTNDANGKDLIVVSSSVGSGNIATKFTAAAVPLINAESAIYDELGMDANNAGGATIAGLTNIAIVNCAHPLAAGLSAGPVTVLTAPGPIVVLATPFAGAQVIATLNDASNTPAIFAYEKGAPLLPARIAAAPARRVGIFWEATTFMTADGLRLFDAAVAWATAAPVPTNAPIGITSQPAHLTINASAVGTFSVGFTGAAPYSVQWQRSNEAGGFTNIPGATCATYPPAENGVVLRAVVTNSFNSVTSSVATLHVKQALFVTAAALATGDNAVSNRLASLGFAVTRVDAIASASSDANGKDLIVVSSSVASGDVSTKFTASPVPLINGESAIYDELGIDLNNTGRATVTGQTNIIIVDCIHPIAAGLPRGPVTVLTAAGPLVTLATPVASAQIIATLDNGSGQPSVFAIEAGAPLLPARIATAPARRVGIFWEATTFMNANGLKIFDAAVAWATGTPAPTNTPIAITTQPANVSVNETVPASFSVGFSGAGPYSIQWQRNNGAGGFTNIPGATCPTFVTGPTVPSDNGASFSVVISNGFSSVTSSVATLTVVFDRTPPTMVLAFGGGSPPTSFDLTYSEPVDPSIAGEVLSYELASGASLNSAVLDADGKTVHFTSDPITNGTVVRLTTALTDRAFTPNMLRPGDPGSSIAIITTGGAIRRHRFDNIGGGVLIPDLTNNIKFPNSPDVVDFPTLFETPVDAADNYGVQLLGFVTAPITGNYRFFLSSDDAGLLFLSTDENPANKTVVAREPVWANSRLLDRTACRRKRPWPWLSTVERVSVRHPNARPALLYRDTDEGRHRRRQSCSGVAEARRSRAGQR